MNRISDDNVMKSSNMKKFFILLAAIVFSFTAHAQSSGQVYDSVLAKDLGADEYGMKSYIFVLITPGSNHLAKGAARDSIFRGHRINIGKLAAAGKLVVAGPFEDNPKSYQGIFILNVKTIGEARSLLETDPAIHAKVLDTELYEWYGSAALGEYLKLQKKITKKQF
jgi:uncharacterized protein YciI